MLIQANMTEMRVNTEQTHKLYQNNETCLTTALSPNKAHVQTKIFLIYYRIFGVSSIKSERITRLGEKDHIQETVAASVFTAYYCKHIQSDLLQSKRLLFHPCESSEIRREINNLPKVARHLKETEPICGLRHLSHENP